MLNSLRCTQISTPAPIPYTHKHTHTHIHTHTHTHTHTHKHTRTHTHTHTHRVMKYNKSLVTGFASSRLELIKFIFTITSIMLLLFYEIYVLLVPKGFAGR